MPEESVQYLMMADKNVYRTTLVSQCYVL